MFNIIAEKFIAGITAIATFIGGGFGLVPQEKVFELENRVQQLELQLEDFQNVSLGSFYAVGGKYYRLWGSGITSSATSLILISFKSPVNDQELTMTNFGEIGFGTIEPENTSNIEFISFSGITQESGSDKATLTGVNRGLNFVYPYNASTTLGKSHVGGSRFIISNPPSLYGEFTAKKNAESITGDWTFSATSTPQYNANPDFTSGSREFASIKFAEDQANQGAATISTTTAGIGVIAGSQTLIHFTTSTYGASSTPYLLRAYDAATSTDKRGATTTIVLTDTDGKIDQTFIDRDESWAFQSSTTIYATTTLGNAESDVLWVHASTTFNASTTFENATSTFDRLPVINSDSTNATSTGFYYIATQGYVSNEDKDFGAWTSSTAASIAYDFYNVYRATSTAGFMCYNWNLNDTNPGSINNWMRSQVYTDAGVSPTRQISSTYQNFTVNTAFNMTITDCFPVKKNEYWKIVPTSQQNGTMTTTTNFFWISLK